MIKLAIAVVVFGALGCGASQSEAPAPHKNHVDDHAARVIAAMPGDLHGVVGISLPHILESQTLSLLLAPLFDDAGMRDLLTEAENTCHISLLDDVTRVFMGFGQSSGRVTLAVLGKFQPRQLAGCVHVLAEKHLGDHVKFDPRSDGYGIVISDPAMRIEVTQRDGVIMFDLPRLERDKAGKRAFVPSVPTAGDRGLLKDNTEMMKAVSEVDTEQAVWMVSSGDASKRFLTEPPSVMWLDASAKPGLDIELGFRYRSGDAAEIGRSALSTMLETFLGSPARELIKRIHLSVSGSDAVLNAKFDLPQTNELAALLVTTIGG